MRCEGWANDEVLEGSEKILSAVFHMGLWYVSMVPIACASCL
ncbi:hypothetical protein HMPREF1162_0365 [ [[Propionibacterium] namnetense SK182B-JCVI]|uniref:Uncharacterized protein n=1 Tax=[Propionibacterium] namnetense SK182B-JCVI TaxID=1051006 RepID=F9NTJ2_9ACTN|nr:hypothetical protein HMPREF1162_0365 [ [[Propionibacterium] namnetense SK182B-JCVI]